jgi:hypothetical protein
MKRAHHLAISLAFLAMTSACAKHGGANTAASNTGAGSPAAASAPAAPGQPITIPEADLPHPQAGLWQVTTSVNGGPPHVERNCNKGETDIRPPRMNRAACPKLDVARMAGGGYTLDADCAERGVSAKAHVAISGNFHTTFASDSEITTNFRGRTMTTRSHTESHYIGPCPG